MQTSTTIHICSDRPVYSIGLRTNTTTDEPFPFVRMEPAHKEYYNAGTNSPTVRTTIALAVRICTTI